MLKIASLTVLAAVVIIQPVFACKDNPDQPVIVIGAGVAGLGAAQQLKKLGCKNVTVLESRNRIGGRIDTQTMGTTKVDMGASWIHGIGPGAGDIAELKGKMNPIFTIAQDNNIQTVATWLKAGD